MLHFKSIKKFTPLKPEKRAVRFFIRICSPILGIQYWGAYPTNCAFFTFVYFVFKKFLGAAFIYIDG